MDTSMIAINFGRNSYSVVGLDAIGKVVARRRMWRETVITYAATLPACSVAMKVCCGAHHMGRASARQGHAVRLMFKVQLDQGQVAHVDDRVGTYRRSAFIREAIRRELERTEKDDA